MRDDEGEDHGPKQEKRGRSSKEDEATLLLPENLADRFRKEATECKAEADRALARALGVDGASVAGGDTGAAGSR